MSTANILKERSAGRQVTKESWRILPLYLVFNIFGSLGTDLFQRNDEIRMHVNLISQQLLHRRKLYHGSSLSITYIYTAN
jgi:hypothetical protein